MPHADRGGPTRSHETWNSEAKYETLLASIDEGFCVVQVVFDADGRAVDYVFVETNASFERLAGIPNAVGRTMRSISPRHEEHWFRTYGEVAKTGKAVRFEAPAEALGRWYNVYAFRVGEPGQCLVAILFNDDTRRKQLERSVESSMQALLEADMRKDRFLATLSHELRNPLAPLKVAAELLGRKGLGEEKAKQTRDIIRRQVSLMAHLLDDLLDISRITQGKLVLRRRTVRPTELIDAAIEAVRPLLERKQHTLDVRMDPQAALLEVDPGRITQVVSNLLGNAAKYTDPGGRIVLAARIDEGEFVIEVSDTGIGLPRAALDEVFEMFSQVHETSERNDGGLGIGLALVKGLVELHGGSVEAFSDGPGLGSRFTVRLPLAAAPVESATPTRPAVAAHDRRKILVADDNRDAAESLAMLLSHFGHEVRTAFDGSSALSVARAFQPDVAFLDIGMPRLNGYELAKCLRKEPWAGSLVLIAATGWGDAEALRKAKEAGFDRHLTKPVSPEELAAELSAARRA